MNKRTMVAKSTEFTTRETPIDGGAVEARIDGYFSVFGEDYEIGQGMSESIDPHAFDEALTDDVRALIDHDTRLVLGRTHAGTLELRVDNHGLFGSVLINPNDQDAVNCYERVKRGDVSQCSFGFDILDELTEVREDGSIHWTVKKVKLYEVSVCTFPAYVGTEVSARSEDAKKVRAQKLETWKDNMRTTHSFLKMEGK